MGIIIGTLLTMALQVGASYINQRNNKKTMEEIKERQREFKAEFQEHGIRRDYGKFRRSCELQLQMEEESHNERLDDIDKDFDNWFVKMAHKAMLESHYPLTISPYIIKSFVMPFCGNRMGEKRKELFCMLTNSNDNVFNANVIPLLDDALCNIISSVWNERSMHTLCYYPNIWKQNISYSDEDLENMKAIIITPTIAVSPFFERRKDGYTLIVKLDMWGDNIDRAIRLETGIHFASMPTTYSSDQIKSILSILFPIVICAIAQNVDVYYWTNYYLPPILPSVLSRGLIPVGKDVYNEFGQAYMELFLTLALGLVAPNSVCAAETSLLTEVAGMNQCNFPERAVGFLEEAARLAPTRQSLETMIMNTLSSLYEARTSVRFGSLDEIDVDLLDKNDMNQITRMIGIAKKGNDFELARRLVGIVRRKIQSWNF